MIKICINKNISNSTEDKNCKNCYWCWSFNNSSWCIHKKDKPKENVCQSHKFICYKCEVNEPKYEYKGKQFCTRCLLKIFNVEQNTTTLYYLNNKFLGTDDNLSEIIQDLDKEIEEI